MHILITHAHNIQSNATHTHTRSYERHRLTSRLIIIIIESLVIYQRLCMLLIIISFVIHSHKVLNQKGGEIVV